TDAKTGQPIPFANVRYEKGGGGQTDTDGNFSLPFKAGRIYVSIIGYDTKNFKVSQPGHHQVKLDPTDLSFDEVVVTGRKDKYSRKNNPAVELMRKVIAAKKNNNLKEHDYYSIDRYSKLTLAFNEMTERVFQEGEFKKFAFLKEHVETCNETGKLILPLSVDEAVTRYIYRKDPETEKSIVLGKRSTGVNDLINTGEIMSTMLQDCFSDVDIYQDDIRLLQYPFTSPISSKTAIGFYRYFIEDTLQVDNEKCIHVSFTPNNSQDFGFSGNLYIVADSTYRVKRVQMGVPMRTGINFVEGMDITQVYEQLPSGEQVLIKDDMIVQLRLAKFIQKFQVRRTTEYSNYDFSKIPDKAFRFKGDQMTAANAMMQDEEFWEERRSEDLTASEDKMSLFIKRLEGIKGFKPVLFVGKAFIENFVETSVDPKHPSKVDIGPVNTMISQNFVDGLRLRASAQTTANLHPHIFLRGYVAYGFKDHRWKGLGEVTYSFNEKAYLPREFPVNNLTFTYNRDVMSPSDKFMPTDKDNVFISFKWTDVEHMMYYENYTLRWDREWENGVRFKLQLRTEENEPTAALFYQPLIAGSGPTKQGYLGKIRTTDLTAALTYQPGAKWMNTKQRRIAANNDAPIYSLSHTTGVEGVLGSDYTYNVTEAGVYKRFWMNSWGKIDVNLKGGVQWNKVPYPLLIMPAANLSYIIEDNTFNLIDNMEFLNDRYASLMLSWDMNGKLFNRIPLLKKLKWREFIGCNVLWGTLSSKNNPFLEKNAGDARLFYFPGTFDAETGTYDYLSHVMDKKTPYVEVVAGIHNIFKLFHIQYVHRLTYVDRPDTQKWGIRFML
ncbi:MAG: carboxypeptidase-like regulatory domain-containing protein, partial [Bacteroidaceae bacterium]|nr:carboxypeptidase-like regulatory domain-containing protein [Bacteroidaceae bacterium]